MNTSARYCSWMLQKIMSLEGTPHYIHIEYGIFTKLELRKVLNSMHDSTREERLLVKRPRYEFPTHEEVTNLAGSFGVKTLHTEGDHLCVCTTSAYHIKFLALFFRTRRLEAMRQATILTGILTPVYKNAQKAVAENQENSTTHE